MEAADVKPHKKVHFGLSQAKSDLSSGNHIECRIGRRILHLTYDELDLNEVKTLFALVSEIESFKLSSEDFMVNTYNHDKTMQTLQHLFLKIFELSTLSCLNAERKNIEEGLAAFVDDLFWDLKAIPIPLGQTGFDVYLMQLKMLNQYVKDVRHAFTGLGVDPKNTGLSSLMLPESYKGAEVHGFPTDVVAFFKTLDPYDRQNINYWLRLLRAYDDNVVVLSAYASEIVVQLQLHYAEHERFVVRFLSHLRVFLDVLRTEEPQLSGVSILENILSDAITPPRTSLRMAKPAISSRSNYANDLKKMLKNLETTKKFEEDFLRTRIELDACLSKIEKSGDKKLLLADLRGYIAEKMDPELKRVVTLLKYLAHTEKRIDKPFTDELTDRYVMLRTVYGNEARLAHSNHLHFTAIQCAKGDFIERLKTYIESHPSQSYAKCIREAVKTAPPRIKSLVASANSFRFFDGQHRFRDFIQILGKSEPDYDASLPAHSSTSSKKGVKA